MYCRKKTIALLTSVVMTLSLALNPILAVYASAPTVKPPSLKVPGVNTPGVKPPVAAPAKRLETPARVQRVSYVFKDEVKKLPTTLQYDSKPLTLDKFASFDQETKSPSASSRKLPSAVEAQDETQLTLDKINGIKYPAGAKLLAIPRSSAAAFAPKTNEIYIDEEAGAAFKILGEEEADASGNSQYVVGTPELTEIFKSYTIPEQTIDLTTGNIAYIAPEFELSPDSGMPRQYTAKAGPFDDIISIAQAGNKHILTLKQGVTVFKYPFEEEKASQEDAEAGAKKKKFEGDWWEKDQSTDLRGVENESELSVVVKVKEGTITIEDPKFHAYFDLDPLTSHVVADFYFDAKAEADVTLEGDITFNKTIEKCVYGYEIDLGKVMGKEKANKAFVGIFLVIGVEGKIRVEVRTITKGDARAGFTYRALGYGGLPYYAGPYAIYRPSSFDMSFTVNGEINTTLACVPQVGVIIWGKELGVLQIWVGFKSKAVFSASGGGGSGGSQGFVASGSIDLRAFGELVGYLLGSRYSIFYIEFPLYYGEWSIGEEASGSGGDGLREVPPYVRVKADAYTNQIEGKIAYSTEGKAEINYMGEDSALEDSLKPYADSVFLLEVYDKDSNLKLQVSQNTDADGRFVYQLTGLYNLLPTDKVYINLMKNMTPEIDIDNQKIQVVGKSGEIKPTVPFSEIDMNLDAFNDVITGWVSGNYTGPVDISILKGTRNETVAANAVNGLFYLEYPIDESTAWASASVNFEGSLFPKSTPLCYPNLDSLTINIFNDFSPSEESAAETGANPSITVPGINTEINMPESLSSAQERLDNLSSQDIEGNKLIKPTRIIGTISNKGDMGWLESQGDEYVRPGISRGNLRHFDGEVKITEIYVQSALDHLREKLGEAHILPYSQSEPLYTAAVETQRAMMLTPVKDSSRPGGVRIESYPTSAAQFEFNRPEVAAYKIEIEHEGHKLERIYNPFAEYYENVMQFNEDFLGPLKEEFTSVKEEKIESVVNPADTMNLWQGAWATQIGKMELTQRGAAVTGTIMQGGKALTVEGKVTDGVFRGSCLIPSETGFGSIASFEMSISADGKRIDFGNIGTNSTIRSLYGTRAMRQ